MRQAHRKSSLMPRTLRSTSVRSQFVLSKTPTRRRPSWWKTFRRICWTVGMLYLLFALINHMRESVIDFAVVWPGGRERHAGPDFASSLHGNVSDRSRATLAKHGDIREGNSESKSTCCLVGCTCYRQGLHEKVTLISNPRAQPAVRTWKGLQLWLK